MSERGLPLADGARACPFVAFEDDRDERATVPDHRHRCYAEVRPAPRALAHQEAYCLSSSFPVCPTFQDWARRESARARDARDAAASAAAADATSEASSGSAEGDTDDERRPTEPHPEVAAAGFAAAAGSAASAATGGRLPGDDDDDADSDAADRDASRYDDEEPRRNPPRDWSAPPPWLASAEAATRGTPSEPPDFLARRSEPGRGLAGSAADVLAGGSPPPRPSRLPEPGDRTVDRGYGGDDEDVDFEERDLPRPAPAPRRPRAYDQHLGGPSSGPDWERPRRYEAYPTIKTRMGMPAVPRLAVMAGVLGIGALAFFFLPGLLGMGAGDPVRTSPSPSPSVAASVAPTPIPEPTPILYRIKKGDTLSKIATANGITLEELLAANPSIKDPNKISEGQEITIPLPAPDVPEDFGPSEEPSEAPAP